MSSEREQGVALKPREFLRQAECLANRIRKSLREQASRCEVAGRSGVMDDAAKLAVTVERLAQHGQQLCAAEAIAVAEFVEIQIDVLLAYLDELLAS